MSAKDKCYMLEEWNHLVAEQAHLKLYLSLAEAIARL